MKYNPFGGISHYRCGGESFCTKCGKMIYPEFMCRCYINNKKMRLDLENKIIKKGEEYKDERNG